MTDIDDFDDEDDVKNPSGKINYLSNKKLMKEINNSKLSYCEFVDEKYSVYDIILTDLSQIYHQENIEQAKKSRAKRMAIDAYNQAIAGDNLDGRKVSSFLVDHTVIDYRELVFRVYTYEHVPLAPGRKKTPKRTADMHAKTNFVPFKHYILDENMQPVEVGRSHSKDGKFSATHGSITNNLANMFIMMTDRYAQRSNWRGYTYLDEMKGQALLQLSQMGLQFDESRTENPFAYFTMVLQNSFTRILNIEKDSQNLRDDLLINSGASPSFSRQLELEAEIRRLREENDHKSND